MQSILSWVEIAVKSHSADAFLSRDHFSKKKYFFSKNIFNIKGKKKKKKENQEMPK